MYDACFDGPAVSELACIRHLFHRTPANFDGKRGESLYSMDSILMVKT